MLQELQTFYFDVNKDVVGKDREHARKVSNGVSKFYLELMKAIEDATGKLVVSRPIIFKNKDETYGTLMNWSDFMLIEKGDYPCSTF